MATRIKFLGHACFQITTPGDKVVIIDPWIEGNPLASLKVADIKKANLVLVTHDHFDHSANAVDVAKNTGATVIAQPETITKFVSELGLPQEQALYGMGMNIGGSVQVQGITVTMTEAFHSSATASCSGYILKLEDGTVLYHAGDTGIFEGMRLLGELYKIDLAMLPIGSVFVMDPFQAAKALTLLKPKTVIPMHYKTFPILEQDANSFVELAKKEAPGVKVVVLEPGEEFSLG